MSISVNTNSSSMTTVRSLNKSDRDLQQVESRMNTGLKVNSAKDNGAIYAMAQTLRADISGLGAVRNSLDIAVAVGDVALTATEALTDLISEMQEKALAAADPGLDDRSRGILNEDFIKLRDQMESIVNNAGFNDFNLIDGSTTNMRPITDAKGGKEISVPGYDLKPGGADTDMIPSMVIDPLQDAKDSLSRIESTLEKHHEVMNILGGRIRTMDTMRTLVIKTADVLSNNLGTLVDADLGREAAKLQAEQTKRDLRVQSLNIANQLPTYATQLFDE